jgi:hypothetical protein
VVINTDKEDPPALIDEDREFGERLIASVRVAADDFEGDGVSGMLDPNLYTVTGETRRFMEMSSSQVMPTLTKKVLARKGHIRLDKVQKTLHAMTHAGLRTVIHPLTRRYQTCATRGSRNSCFWIRCLPSPSPCACTRAPKCSPTARRTPSSTP